MKVRCFDQAQLFRVRHKHFAHSSVVCDGNAGCWLVLRGAASDETRAQMAPVYGGKTSR